MVTFVALTSRTTLHMISDMSGHMRIIKRRPKMDKGLLGASWLIPWASANNCGHNSDESGTKALPRNSSNPSTSDQPSGAEPTTSCYRRSLAFGRSTNSARSSSKRSNVCPDTAWTARPSSSRRDKASATTFWLPGRYSTLKS